MPVQMHFVIRSPLTLMKLRGELDFTRVSDVENDEF